MLPYFGASVFGSYTVQSAVVVTSAASLSASAVLMAGSVAQTSAAALSASGTLAAGALLGQASSAPLSATGTLTAALRGALSSGAALTAIGTLVAGSRAAFTVDLTFTSAPASVDQTFHTAVVLDVAGPIISQIAMTTGQTSATVTWLTDEPATSQLEYGVTSGYGSQTTLNVNLITSHSVTISGLNPSANYHLRIRSQDAAGNLSVSTDIPFTTVDTTAPSIGGISAQASSPTVEVILWSTNEPATSQVQYGLTTAYGLSTALDPVLRIDHAQGLTGLTPDTTYHFRVQSADASGNLATSADQVFRTAEIILPQVATISDGTDSVSLYDYEVAALADGGHDLGIPGASPRTLKIVAHVLNASRKPSLSELEATMQRFRRLLAKAERTTALGLSRQVMLTIQPAGIAAPTRYYLLGGSVPPVAPWQHEYQVGHYYEAVPLTLLVEPWGYGDERMLVTSGSVTARSSIDGRFVASGALNVATDGTPLGSFVPSVVNGPLSRINNFSTTVLVATMANNLAFYFGSTHTPFNELITGVSAPKSGVWAGTWEYLNTGGTWQNLATISDFRSGDETTEWDVARPLGMIRFFGGAPANWATKQFSTSGLALTCWWVRYRITSYTNGAAPLLINGPVRSLVGLASVPAGSVPGDGEAVAMVHLGNPNPGPALAGMKVAIATGESLSAATAPPPFIIPISGADQFIPSTDTTAVVTLDGNTSAFQRVDVTVVQSIIDRGQIFNGSTDYLTVTPTASDKLATMFGAGSWTVEALINPTAVQTGPRCLISQWGTNTANQVVWFGIDKGKLYGTVRDNSGKKWGFTGSSTIPENAWSLVALVYEIDDQKLQLKRDGETETSLIGPKTIRSGQTTPIQVGRSSGFNPGDTPSGQAEIYYKGAISNVRFLDRTPKEEHQGGYDWPALGGKIQLDSGHTRWLLKLDDNTANTVIVDSASIYNGVLKNAARSTGNTNANTTVGYFQPGAGQVARLIGLNLPETWANEYRGRVRVFLRATPAAPLSSTDDVQFRLQLNLGDVALPMGPPGRFPSVDVPSELSWYLVDLGLHSLPAMALRWRGPGQPLTTAQNTVQASLFVQHAFNAPTVLRLDCLYLLPTATWYGEWQSFRKDYDTTYDLDPARGVIFDSLGTETVIGRTTPSGYTDQSRNPYQQTGGSSRIRLISDLPAWLFAIPLRGTFTDNVSYTRQVLGDELIPRIHAIGLHNALAPGA